MLRAPHSSEQRSDAADARSSFSSLPCRPCRAGSCGALLLCEQHQRTPNRLLLCREGQAPQWLAARRQHCSLQRSEREDTFWSSTREKALSLHRSFVQPRSDMLLGCFQTSALQTRKLEQISCGQSFCANDRAKFTRVHCDIRSAEVLDRGLRQILAGVPVWL